jgi:hypothetical protein
MALETKALGVISLINTERGKKKTAVVGVFPNLKHDNHLGRHFEV